MDLTIHTGSFGLFILAFGFITLTAIIFALKDFIVTVFNTKYAVKVQNEIVHGLIGEDADEADQPTPVESENQEIPHGF